MSACASVRRPASRKLSVDFTKRCIYYSSETCGVKTGTAIRTPAVSIFFRIILFPDPQNRISAFFNTMNELLSNYKLTIQYDGTRYSGWQRQGNTDGTIQDRLEREISELLGKETLITGSGRTDAGVHALGQTANFHTDCPLGDEFLVRLNRALPGDIAVTELEQVPPRFHARLSAREKIYRYTVRNSPISDVFARRFQYQMDAPLDLPRMREAAAKLTGTHDFAGFSTGHTKKSTVLTLREVRIYSQGPLVEITFTGDGFLYNMARILTGTLLEIGTGQRDMQEIDTVFETGNRQKAGFTAPARGLCLMRVVY